MGGKPRKKPVTSAKVLAAITKHLMDTVELCEDLLSSSDQERLDLAFNVIHACVDLMLLGRQDRQSWTDQWIAQEVVDAFGYNFFPSEKEQKRIDLLVEAATRRQREIQEK